MRKKRTGEPIRATLIEANPWLGLAAYIPLALGTAIMMVMRDEVGARVWLASFAVSIVLGRIARSAATAPRRRRVDVRVDDDGHLRVGDRRVLRRKQITTAVLGTDGKSVHLYLGGQHEALEVAMETRRDAKRLLRELGHEAHTRVATFGTPSWLWAGGWIAPIWGLAYMVLAAAIGFGAMLITQSSSLAASLFFAAIAPFILGMLVPGNVRVGTDGIEMKWMWMRRFVGYDDLVQTTVRQTGDGAAKRETLILDTRDGVQLELPIEKTRTSTGHAKRIAKRIRQEHGGYQQAAERRDNELAALRKRSDDPDAWLASLRQLGRDGGTHRRASVDRKQLLRVAEDPTAPHVDRAAAAIALHERIDPKERQRLRIAAEATVTPELRRALEVTAELENASVDEADATFERVLRTLDKD